MFDGRDEDLAVANLAGLSRGFDGLNDFVGAVRRNGDLDPDFGKKIHGVFGPAINFRMALLAAVTLDLGDGQSLHTDAGEGVVDVLELRSEEHTSELQSQSNLVCRLLLEKKKKKTSNPKLQQKKSTKVLHFHAHPPLASGVAHHTHSVSPHYLSLCPI